MSVTPLIYAIRGMTSTDVVRYLLDRGADPNKADNSGITPFHVATKRGSLGCMKLLIEARADVNAGNPVPPLLIAAGKGLIHCISVCWKLALMQTFLMNGFLTNGKVPVEIAAFQGWEDCVKILFTVLSMQTGALMEYFDMEKLALDMDPADSTVYAKRSICFQHMNDKEHALADANAYQDMQQDLPKSCSEEEGAAMKLVEDYWKGIEALMLT
ncbi:hypothetical protein ACP70R_039066 [Stipagrostis hirtigluma subsp. patula]